jgi:hypothetical protein
VNAKGVTIAKDVAELHGTNNLTKQTALNEKGEVTNGRGDTPNRHDIFTGSQADGTAFPDGQDRTCKNWTSSTQGAAMVGHADRTGLTEDPPQKSRNSSHPSRGSEGGCSQADLVSTGGAGLFLLFCSQLATLPGHPLARDGRCRRACENIPPRRRFCFLCTKRSWYSVTTILTVLLFSTHALVGTRSGGAFTPDLMA